MNTSANVQASGKPEQGCFYLADALALAAAGAFSNPAYQSIPPESRRMSLIVSYTKGAAAASGNAVFRVQWRIAAGAPEGLVTDVYETVIDGTTVTKADPFLLNPEYAYSIAGPITTTSIAFRLLSVEVPIMATGVRVLAAELGDTVNPGTITIRAYTSVEI